LLAESYETINHNQTTENKTRQKLSAKLSKGARGISEKRGPEVTVSRSPPLISTPAHRGRWKLIEADNEKGA